MVDHNRPYKRTFALHQPMSALPPRADMCGAIDHVRFGSKADLCDAKCHVRFTPNSDRKSRHAAKVMSALPPKADMCGATRDVRFGPKADIGSFIRSPRRQWRAATAELSDRAPLR